MIMSATPKATTTTNKRQSSNQLKCNDQKRLKTNIKMVCSYNANRNSCESSSDDDSEFDYGYEEGDGYDSTTNNHLAPVIGSPIVDHNTTRAICQYSEAEDDIEHDKESEGVEFNFKQKRSNSSILNTNYNDTINEVESIFSNDNCFINNKRYSINVAELVSNKTPDEKIQQVQHSVNGNFQDDIKARNRCVDYLVNAIDDVWSRYCDGTSYEEDIAYNYDDKMQQQKVLNSSGDEDEDNGYKSELSNYTSVTEYDSDMAASAALKTNRSMSIMGNSSNVKINSENFRLQELKGRLTKAKYYLEEFIDSLNLNDCIQFWKKWDLIKYSTIELVEDDDDDEIIEKKIEELEHGRYWGSFS